MMLTKAEVAAMLDQNQDAKIMRMTAELGRLRRTLDLALTVCRCAARVIDSRAFQGVSDEDCDLEHAVRNWRALGA